MHLVETKLTHPVDDEVDTDVKLIKIPVKEESAAKTEENSTIYQFYQPEMSVSKPHEVAKSSATSADTPVVVPVQFNEEGSTDSHHGFMMSTEEMKEYIIPAAFFFGVFIICVCVIILIAKVVQC